MSACPPNGYDGHCAARSATIFPSHPKSPVPILDVHPPHEPTHTWTDFFIHISTICVGLLIAIGLEQSVEAIHRHGERSDLVESLQHESEQILRDAIRVETAVSAEVQWQRQVGAAVAVANSSHQPIGEIPAAPGKDFDVPGNPNLQGCEGQQQTHTAVPGRSRKPTVN